MKLVRLIILVAITLVSLRSFGQDPSFSVYIQNGNYLAANIYQFDVMIVATGPTTTFQLRTFQAGLFVNPAWVNGGTLTIQNAPTFTSMAGPGYNGAFQWNATDNLINCSVNYDVVNLNGCISTTVTTTPLLIGKIQVNNTVNFPCLSPDIKFNYVANASPYKLRTDISWRAVGCTTNYDMFYPGRTYTGTAIFNNETYTSGDADGKSPVSAFNGTGFCLGQLSITAILQAYYSGQGHMNSALYTGSVAHANDQQADTIVIELRSSVNPHGAAAATFKTILYADGKAYCTYPSNSSLIGNSYWIVLKHRNAIETWSSSPVTIAMNTNYDFTTAQNKAYGSNMIRAFDNNQLWTVYSGDISDPVLGLGHQDGLIESQDYLDEENAVSIIKSGYVVEDISGDALVEAADYGIMENNVSHLVSVVTP
jgi:hypothetical protein